MKSLIHRDIPVKSTNPTEELTYHIRASLVLYCTPEKDPDLLRQQAHHQDYDGTKLPLDTIQKTTKASYRPNEPTTRPISTLMTPTRLLEAGEGKSEISFFFFSGGW
ncbi:unnamed protein product [Brassica oleracea]